MPPGLSGLLAVALSCALRDSRDAPCARVDVHERVDVVAARVDADVITPPLRGASLGPAELVALGGDVSRAMDVAADAAGAFFGSRRVRIDGLVSAVPPARVAAGVSVRADPFSVEYGGLDQIELAVDLLPPSPSWIFTAAPPVWQGGAGDPLTGRSPAVRRIGGLVAGPGPVEPLTFFAQADRLAHREARAFAAPDGRVIADDERGVTSTRSHSAAAGVAWSGGATLVRASLFTGATNVANAGIGGLSTPDAAFTLSTASTQAVVSWDISRGVRHRGGVTLGTSRAGSEAHAAGPATVSPALIVSGVEQLRSRADSVAWSARHVVQSLDRRWLAGFEVSREARRESRLFNPAGVRRLGTDGRMSLTETHAWRDVALTTTSAAAFAEGIVPLRRWGALRPGLRAELLDSEGLFLSPRMSWGARIGAIAVTASGALAAEEWTGAGLAALRWRDGRDASWLVDGTPLALRIDESFRRRRDAIGRAGLARRVGPVQAAIEHTWTRGLHLTASTRALEAGTLVDTLAADRALDRHQTHFAVQSQFGALTIVAHYEWIRGSDDTDGWLSLPAAQTRPDAEWARSTGLARHHGSVVITGRLWPSIHVIAALRAAAGAPFSVLSGTDPERLGTFTDRSGLSRNSEQTPGWTNLNLYLSRTFRLPRLSGAVLDAGVRLENLLDGVRVDEVGRVSSTPLFGKPLSAGPGRSTGLWFSLARR